MEAWSGWLSGLLAAHPFVAPLFLFWWQAAFHDVVAFINFKSWNDVAEWDYRRMLLTWMQGIAAGIVGVPVAQAVSTAAGPVVGLLAFAGLFLAVPAARTRITTRGPWLVLAVALTAGAVGCAHIPVKQKATLGLQAAHTAVAGAQDIERGLYAARLAGLTPEKHGQFAGFFSAYFDAEQRVALALRAWRAGDPAPESLADAMTVLREAVDTAVTLSDGAEKDSIIGKLGTGIRHVQAVLDAVTGGGQ